jgi:hypothetical protein
MALKLSLLALEFKLLGLEYKLERNRAFYFRCLAHRIGLPCRKRRA